MTRGLEYRALEDLMPAEVNPKRHNLEALRGSIARFGFVAPVVVDERTGRVVAGHGRAEALRAAEAAGLDPPDGVRIEAGQWHVPVVVGWASRDDAEALAYLLADNRQTELGGWDEALLAQALATVADDASLLSATGYSEADLAALMAGVDDLDNLLQAIEPLDEPTSRLDQRAPTTCPACGHQWRPGR